MLLREVGYARPSSLDEALSLLAATDGARALAGGQTLVNVMKARAASPDALIDLNGLGELKGIDLAADGTLRIGAMATYTEIAESAEARARPILGEVCATIADVQVRNRGTIGGNVCSNDPTNHLPPLLAAVGAQMTIAGAGGERTVPADDFFLGVYMTAVGPVVLQPESADEQAVRAAVREARLDPPSDVHASSEYRAHLAGVLAVRAANDASHRARS